MIKSKEKMRKSFLILLACFAVASCAVSSKSGSGGECPQITIPQDKSYLVQKAGYADEFQVRLTGYESYCYRDDVAARSYAMIRPQFLIRRLRATDETRVDFDFYAETVKGPPGYIGKKSYPVFVNIETGEREKTFSGPAAKVKIPSGEPGFEIFLGLDLSASEYEANRRGFNIDYQFEEETDLRYVPTVYVETGDETGELRTEPAVWEEAPRPASGKNDDCGCSL